MPETDGAAGMAADQRVLPDDDPSVHDNLVLGYEVRCSERQIRLRTEYHDQEPPERTDVLFSGVLAYHFEHALMDAILFDIEEAPLEQVYEEYAEVFRSGKNYGWPIASYSGPEDLLERLRAQGVRAFVVSSSYGMSGFVLAEAMEKVRVRAEGVDAGTGAQP